MHILTKQGPWKMSQQELCPETETTCYSPFTAVCKSLALHRVDGWMGRQKITSNALLLFHLTHTGPPVTPTVEISCCWDGLMNGCGCRRAKRPMLSYFLNPICPGGGGEGIFNCSEYLIRLITPPRALKGLKSAGSDRVN